MTSLDDLSAGIMKFPVIVIIFVFGVFSLLFYLPALIFIFEPLGVPCTNVLDCSCTSAGICYVEVLQIVLIHDCYTPTWEHLQEIYALTWRYLQNMNPILLLGLIVLAGMLFNAVLVLAIEIWNYIIDTGGKKNNEDRDIDIDQEFKIWLNKHPDERSALIGDHFLFYSYKAFFFAIFLLAILGCLMSLLNIQAMWYILQREITHSFIGLLVKVLIAIIVVFSVAIAYKTYKTRHDRIRKKLFYQFLKDKLREIEGEGIEIGKFEDNDVKKTLTKALKLERDTYLTKLNEMLNAKLVLLDTNVDDCTPEVLSHLMYRVMDEGALDIHVLHTIMKKGRPGYLIRILTTDPEKFSKILMEETGTLDVRIMQIERFEADRKTKEIEKKFR